MHALIIFRTEYDEFTADDLTRLVQLRQFALDAGYTIQACWPVKKGTNADRAAYNESRKGVQRGYFDVIIQWDEEKGIPLALRAADVLRPAP